MAKKAYAPSRTRAVALVGHRSSGKTSLGDILLRTSGVTRTLGRVEDGTSLFDHEDDERRRGMSFSMAFAWLEWRDSLVHLIDTPGGDGFVHERNLAIQGADGVVVVVSGPDGVENGAASALQVATGARMVVVTKMDRSVDLDTLLLELEESTGLKPVLLQLPFYDHADRFTGVVCLQQRLAFRYDSEGNGAFSPEPIPLDMEPRTAEAWERVMEAVALSDERLLEDYLEFLELPRESVAAGLRDGVRAGQLLPVLLASGGDAIGADLILDAMIDLLPSGEEMARQEQEARSMGDAAFLGQLLATRLDEEGNPYHVLRVWSGDAQRASSWLNPDTGERVRVRSLYQIRGPRRTKAFNTGPGSIVATWDSLASRPGDTLADQGGAALPVPEMPPAMVSSLLLPVGRTRTEELGDALVRLQQLDASLRVSTDDLTGGWLLMGTSEDQVGRGVDLLRTRLGVGVQASLPPVGYREIPATAVSGVEGIYKREGKLGVEEYGACEITLSPVAPADNCTFEAAVDEQELPARFHTSIADGARAAMRHGPTAGYPVVGADVRLTGGGYNILFSTEEHFKAAGERAAKTALQQSGTRLMEPWCEVEIQTPADEVGGVLNAISSNRGRILGMEVDGRVALIKASAPFREMRTFAPRLSSLTGGRGTFTQRTSHYEDLPSNLWTEAIDASPFRKRGGRGDSEDIPR
ncbi:MAG: hypothetical protein JXX28_09670 [Deltaproteobacteria bacterium]|nr:hypothetical protein [Deltaproteobacteria bacterium]